MKNARERRYAEDGSITKPACGRKVEHPSRMIKRQFGYAKIRYRG